MREAEKLLFEVYSSGVVEGRNHWDSYYGSDESVAKNGWSEVRKDFISSLKKLMEEQDVSA